MNTVIEIGTIEALFGIAVVLVGLGAAWGTLKTQVKNITQLLNEDIKPSGKDLAKELSSLRNEISALRTEYKVVEDRVETIWKDRIAPAASPRQLNEAGENILNNSGIKSIIDTNKDKLLNIVKAHNPDNPYDAEQLILEAVNNLPEHCPEVLDDLKEGAFKSGESIASVLFAGGIYLRNSVFNELGFSLDDLDKTT